MCWVLKYYEYTQKNSPGQSLKLAWTSLVHSTIFTDFIRATKTAKSRFETRRLNWKNLQFTTSYSNLKTGLNKPEQVYFYLFQNLSPNRVVPFELPSSSSKLEMRSFGSGCLAEQCTAWWASTRNSPTLAKSDTMRSCRSEYWHSEMWRIAALDGDPNTKLLDYSKFWALTDPVVVVVFYIKT